MRNISNQWIFIAQDILMDILKIKLFDYRKNGSLDFIVSYISYMIYISIKRYNNRWSKSLEIYL